MDVLVFGGCVSRDAIEYASGFDVTLKKYIARSSLLSAGTDARPNLPNIKLSSNFQTKMVLQDVLGYSVQHMKWSSKVDLFLWDINIERVGVWQFPDGSILTNSPEILKAPGVREALGSARFVAFGTDEHFHRWAGAAALFSEALKLLNLYQKVVVLAPEWALSGYDSLGEEKKQEMLSRATTFNRESIRYYQVLEHLGFDICHLGGTVAGLHNKWGVAPFHYGPETYEHLISYAWHSYRSRTRR
ncbi:DUF6270 domain-containing protein [Corynebacterium phocae]|uniref:DUF6270 domain-containing protein n=1 Tax=Corynebacterium phocae TaxID=161895 RepID=UPI000951E652|nr:DUF6270 domain-containing protein [Corynebacterium phocae]KAA8726519.1 hypothetical protein F4V58_03185 [Corynebacterium phocae]